MIHINRNYRSDFTANIILFIEDYKIEGKMINISTSGAKIILKLEQFSRKLKINEIVKFFVPTMQIKGELKIVRKEIVNNNIFFSILFYKNIERTNK